MTSSKSPNGDIEATAFRLLSIQASTAPQGSVGRDWLEYRIGQGANVIKGYRRGDLQTARADVEQIVIALNERRRSLKSAGARRGRKPAAAAKADPRESDE